MVCGGLSTCGPRVNGANVERPIPRPCAARLGAGMESPYSTGSEDWSYSGVMLGIGASWKAGTSTTLEE